jgi:hypothetical protein
MNIHEQARAIIDDFAEIARQDRFGYDSGPFRAAAALRLASVLEGLRAVQPEPPNYIPESVVAAAIAESLAAQPETPAEVRRGPGRPKKG